MNQDRDEQRRRQKTTEVGTPVRHRWGKTQWLDDFLSGGAWGDLATIRRPRGAEASCAGTCVNTLRTS
eukprot:5187101-Pyramimonas_sp.AAC.1